MQKKRKRPAGKCYVESDAEDDDDEDEEEYVESSSEDGEDDEEHVESDSEDEEEEGEEEFVGVDMSIETNLRQRLAALFTCGAGDAAFGEALEQFNKIYEARLSSDDLVYDWETLFSNADKKASQRRRGAKQTRGLPNPNSTHRGPNRGKIGRAHV